MPVVRQLQSQLSAALHENHNLKAQLSDEKARCTEAQRKCADAERRAVLAEQQLQATIEELQEAHAELELAQQHAADAQQQADGADDSASPRALLAQQFSQRRGGAGTGLAGGRPPSFHHHRRQLHRPSSGGNLLSQSYEVAQFELLEAQEKIAQYERLLSLAGQRPSQAPGSSSVGPSAASPTSSLTASRDGSLLQLARAAAGGGAGGVGQTSAADWPRRSQLLRESLVAGLGREQAEQAAKQLAGLEDELSAARRAADAHEQEAAGLRSELAFQKLFLEEERSTVEQQVEDLRSQLQHAQRTNEQLQNALLLAGAGGGGGDGSPGYDSGSSGVFEAAAGLLSSRKAGADQGEEEGEEEEQQGSGGRAVREGGSGPGQGRGRPEALLTPSPSSPPVSVPGVGGEPWVTGTLRLDAERLLPDSPGDEAPLSCMSADSADERRKRPKKECGEGGLDSPAVRMASPSLSSPSSQQLLRASSPSASWLTGAKQVHRPQVPSSPSDDGSDSESDGSAAALEGGGADGGGDGGGSAEQRQAVAAARAVARVMQLKRENSTLQQKVQELAAENLRVASRHEALLGRLAEARDESGDLKQLLEGSVQQVGSLGSTCSALAQELAESRASHTLEEEALRAELEEAQQLLLTQNQIAPPEEGGSGRQQQQQEEEDTSQRPSSSRALVPVSGSQRAEVQVREEEAERQLLEQLQGLAIENQELRSMAEHWKVRYCNTEEELVAMLDQKLALEDAIAQVNSTLNAARMHASPALRSAASAGVHVGATPPGGSVSRLGGGVGSSGSFAGFGFAAAGMFGAHAGTPLSAAPMRAAAAAEPTAGTGKDAAQPPAKRESAGQPTAKQVGDGDGASPVVQQQEGAVSHPAGGAVEDDAFSTAAEAAGARGSIGSSLTDLTKRLAALRTSAPAGGEEGVQVDDTAGGANGGQDGSEREASFRFDTAAAQPQGSTAGSTQQQQGAGNVTSTALANAQPLDQPPCSPPGNKQGGGMQAATAPPLPLGSPIRVASSCESARWEPASPSPSARHHQQQRNPLQQPDASPILDVDGGAGGGGNGSSAPSSPASVEARGSWLTGGASPQLDSPQVVVEGQPRSPYDPSPLRPTAAQRAGEQQLQQPAGESPASALPQDRSEWQAAGPTAAAAAAVVGEQQLEVEEEAAALRQVADEALRRAETLQRENGILRDRVQVYAALLPEHSPLRLDRPVGSMSPEPLPMVAAAAPHAVHVAMPSEALLLKPSGPLRAARASQTAEPLGHECTASQTSEPQTEAPAAAATQDGRAGGGASSGGTPVGLAGSSVWHEPAGGDRGQRQLRRVQAVLAGQWAVVQVLRCRLQRLEGERARLEGERARLEGERVRLEGALLGEQERAGRAIRARDEQLRSKARELLDLAAGVQAMQEQLDKMEQTRLSEGRSQAAAAGRAERQLAELQQRHAAQSSDLRAERERADAFKAALLEEDLNEEGRNRDQQQQQRRPGSSLPLPEGGDMAEGGERGRRESSSHSSRVPAAQAALQAAVAALQRAQRRVDEVLGGYNNSGNGCGSGDAGGTDGGEGGRTLQVGAAADPPPVGVAAQLQSLAAAVAPGCGTNSGEGVEAARAALQEHRALLLMAADRLTALHQETAQLWALVRGHTEVEARWAARTESELAGLLHVEREREGAAARLGEALRERAQEAAKLADAQASTRQLQRAVHQLGKQNMALVAQLHAMAEAGAPPHYSALQQQQQRGVSLEEHEGVVAELEGQVHQAVIDKRLYKALCKVAVAVASDVVNGTCTSAAVSSKVRPLMDSQEARLRELQINAALGQLLQTAERHHSMVAAGSASGTQPTLADMQRTWAQQEAMRQKAKHYKDKYNQSVARLEALREAVAKQDAAVGALEAHYGALMDNLGRQVRSTSRSLRNALSGADLAASQRAAEEDARLQQAASPEQRLLSSWERLRGQIRALAPALRHQTIQLAAAASGDVDGLSTTTGGGGSSSAHHHERRHRHQQQQQPARSASLGARSVVSLGSESARRSAGARGGPGLQGSAAASGVGVAADTAAASLAAAADRFRSLERQYEELVTSSFSFGGATSIGGTPQQQQQRGDARGHDTATTTGAGSASQQHQRLSHGAAAEAVNPAESVGSPCPAEAAAGAGAHGIGGGVGSAFGRTTPTPPQRRSPFSQLQVDVQLASAAAAAAASPLCTPGEDCSSARTPGGSLGGSFKRKRDKAAAAAAGSSGPDLAQA